jgi:hypothetical protein
MRSTFLFVVMVVMAKTAYGQVIDGGIVEGAIDWVLGTHFTFNGGKPLTLLFAVLADVFRVGWKGTFGWS